MKNSKNNFLANTLALTVSALTVKVLGVIYKIPLSFILGDDGMGYFNSAYTIYATFYLICVAGVPKAVSILTSEAREQGNVYLLKRIYKTTKRLFLSIGIVLTALLLVFAGNLSSLIGNNGARGSIIAISLSLTFVAIAGVERGYLNGLDVHLPIALSEMLEASIKLIVGLLFAKLSFNAGFDKELISAFTIFGISLGTFLSALILLIAAKIKIKEEKTGQKNYVVSVSYRVIIKKILRISLPITLSSFIMSITGVIDLSLVMRRLQEVGYSEQEASALYGNYTTLAVPFLTLCTALVSPVSAAMLPKLSVAKTHLDHRKFNSILESALSVCFFIALPLEFALFLFPEDILTLMFNDASALTAAPLLSVLALGLVFASMLICFNTALECLGKTMIPFIAMSIASVFKIIIGYTFSARSDFGIMSAPVGTLAFYVLSFSIVFLAFQRLGGERVGISRALFPPLFSSALASLLTICTKNAIYQVQSNTVRTLIMGFVFAISYLIFTFLIQKIIFKKCFSSKYTKIAF